MAPPRMRSPLGRAIGLGSAKEGVNHWWAQRISAIALVPLVLWFVIAIIGLVALVLEGGNAYAQQRETQNAADATGAGGESLAMADRPHDGGEGGGGLAASTGVRSPSKEISSPPPYHAVSEAKPLQPM